MNYRKDYCINCRCMNCGVVFTEKIPYGINVKSNDDWLYLFIEEGRIYPNIEGKDMGKAQYLKCVDCGSKNLRKIINDCDCCDC